MGGLAEDDLDESDSKFWLKRVGMILLVLAVGVGGWLLFSSLVSSKVSMKKPVTTVKLLPDTPPPPPPPPPPPKEQPKEQPKEMKVEPPKQEAPQPPSEVLKMEGAAGDGPSPFAAGTVNNEYKGGEVGTKIGGGGNNNRHQFTWFAGLIKSHIEEALAKDKQLSTGKYRVVVHVWVKPDGKMERVELAGSSGDAAVDERIKAVLAELPPLTESPPEDMPQPVKLRITARSAG